MNYVYAGYAVTFVGVALYAVRVLARGRALRRSLPPGDSLSPPELPPDNRLVPNDHR